MGSCGDGSCLGCLARLRVGEAFTLGKLMEPGERAPPGNVGDCDTLGKLMPASIERASRRSVDGLAGVGGSRLRWAGRLCADAAGLGDRDRWASWLRP